MWLFEDEELLSPALHALLGTAVVDKALQERLLTDPATAIQGFQFTREERRAVVGVHGDSSLADFALHLEQNYRAQKRKARQRHDRKSA